VGVATARQENAAKVIVAASLLVDSMLKSFVFSSRAARIGTRVGNYGQTSHVLYLDKLPDKNESRTFVQSASKERHPTVRSVIRMWSD